MLVFHTIKESAAPTAVALGCFDGLHIGHQKVIYRAVAGHELGLSPTVFTFDASPLSDLCGKGAPRLMTTAKSFICWKSWGSSRCTCRRFLRCGISRRRIS